jgi:hypothetical protein
MSNITISKETIQVLKNFSTVNGSLMIREGNVIKTISIGENMVAQYGCPETFPKTFGIYDLSQFIMGLELFANPTLIFDNDEYVTIKDDGKSAKYYFSSPEINLKAAPEKDINFPGADIDFRIGNKDMLALIKASSINKTQDLKFHSVGGTVIISLMDKENETSNVFSLEIPCDNTGEYEFFMKVDNIRLFDGNYHVKISKHLITEWKHSSLDLTYYIALEP